MNDLKREERSAINKRANALSIELREIIRDELTIALLRSKQAFSPMSLHDIGCHVPPSISAVINSNKEGLPL